MSYNLLSSGQLHKTTSGVAVWLVPCPKIVRKADRKLREKHVGAGERQDSEFVRIVFNTSFRYTSSLGVPYNWSILIFYANTDVNHLASRAESNKPGERLKPSYSVHFNTRDSLMEVGRLRYLKRSCRLSPFLLPQFFARLLFRCSSAFFARLAEKGTGETAPSPTRLPRSLAHSMAGRALPAD